MIYNKPIIDLFLIILTTFLYDAPVQLKLIC